MSKCLYRYFTQYECELSKLPFTDSVVGRHVYVCVARSELRKRYFEEEELSIKSLLSSSLCSDRAVRLKIREMENKGYLYSEFSSNDKRIVVLKPTFKLLELIDEHALIFLNAVTKDHHLIEK
jgi:hypothetical protein